MQKETFTFWSVANRSFTTKERQEYNKWRHDLYIATDRLRDYVRNMTSDTPCCDDKTEKYIKAVMDRVTEAPVMLGRRD